MIRVCVAGVTGWTGSAVAAAVEAASDLELVAGVSRADPASYSSVAEALDAVGADVLVDYTHAAAVRGNVLAAVERSVNAVVGSSGLSAADYEEIDALARERASASSRPATSRSRPRCYSAPPSRSRATSMHGK